MKPRTAFEDYCFKKRIHIAKLARRCGLNADTLHDWKAGLRRPSLQSAYLLVDGLGLCDESILWLFPRGEVMQKKCYIV